MPRGRGFVLVNAYRSGLFPILSIEATITEPGGTEIMDTTWSSKSSKKHALILPVTMQAHFVSIYRLSVELAKRGCTLTFVAHERGIAQLGNFEELQEYEYHAMPYCPSQSIQEFSSPAEFLKSLRKSFQVALDKLLENQKAGLPGPTCVIADRFLPWAKDVAQELQVPHYSFLSNGASYARYMQAQPKLYADGTLVTVALEGSTVMREFDGFLNIPGIPPLRHRELPKLSLFAADFSNAISRSMVESDGLIVNTFHDLEAPAIDALQRASAEDFQGRSQKLFLIGPVAYVGTFKDRSVMTGLDQYGTECLQWLDNQPPLSVLYICLGTLVKLNPPEISELALALEATQQSFLWILPVRDGSIKEVLPPDYEARIRGKGLIINGWVPQVQILAHSSVGGFLTHCGWSSLSEGVTSGVPMLAWPQGAEQFVNCKILVEQLKIAVEISTAGRSTNGVERAEFEKAIKLLQEEDGKAMRLRVQVLQMKAKAAVAEGGPSRKALEELVESIPGRT